MFGLQRDDEIAVAPVMNPRAPTRTHSSAAARLTGATGGNRASIYSTMIQLLSILARILSPINVHLLLGYRNS